MFSVKYYFRSDFKKGKFDGILEVIGGLSAIKSFIRNYADRVVLIH